jgi:hypothetical protein
MQKLKALAAAFLVFGNISLCYAQIDVKVVRLPLDNKVGVPFNKVAGGDYLLDGFEVDKNEKIFFMAKNMLTKKTSIVSYSGYKRNFYKSYDLMSGRLYLSDEKLYTTALKDKKISFLNPVNGELLGSASIEATKALPGYKLNSFLFAKGALILEQVKYASEADDYVYQKFSTAGKFISVVKNKYDTPNQMALSKYTERGATYIDDYKGRSIYMEQDGKTDGYFIRICGIDNKEKSVYLKPSALGRPLFGDDEFMKIRNNKLYIVTTDSKKPALIISVIELEKLDVNKI